MDIRQLGACISIIRQFDLIYETISIAHLLGLITLTDTRWKRRS